MLIMNHAVCVAPQLNMHAQDNTVRSGEPTPNADHDDSRLTRAERAAHVCADLWSRSVEPRFTSSLLEQVRGLKFRMLPCTSMFSYSVQPAMRSNSAFV